MFHAAGRDLRRQIDGGEVGALAVTHDLGFAAALADRFIHMDLALRRPVELDVPAARTPAEVPAVEQASGRLDLGGGVDRPDL